MESNINSILDGIKGNPLGGLVVNFGNILKLPTMVILFGNMLFAILLFLRVRILSDTFESPQNKLVKTIVTGYLLVAILGSIVATLFLLIG